MERVRIKYYGIMWLTRGTYLVLQSIALFLSVALTVVGFLAILSTGTILPRLPAKEDELPQLLVLLFWGGLLALLAESMETYLVLRKFARAEAEQRTRLAVLDVGGPAPPSTPHSTEVQPPPEERPHTRLQP